MFGGVKVTTKGLPGISTALVKRRIGESLTTMGVGWNREYKPKHFTASGARVYHYGRRKTKEVTTGQIKTTKSGKPRAPSGKPLSWSGESERRAKRPRIRLSKRNKLSLVYYVNAFNYRPKNNPSLDMRKEFTTVLSSEKRTLEKAGRKDLIRRLRAYNKTTVVTIKG